MELEKLKRRKKSKIRVIFRKLFLFSNKEVERIIKALMKILNKIKVKDRRSRKKKEDKC